MIIGNPPHPRCPGDAQSHYLVVQAHRAAVRIFHGLNLSKDGHASRRGLGVEAVRIKESMDGCRCDPLAESNIFNSD
jgi:hypothetical protein